MYAKRIIVPRARRAAAPMLTSSSNFPSNLRISWPISARVLGRWTSKFIGWYYSKDTSGTTVVAQAKPHLRPPARPLLPQRTTTCFLPPVAMTVSLVASPTSAPGAAPATNTHAAPSNSTCSPQLRSILSPARNRRTPLPRVPPTLGPLSSPAPSPARRRQQLHPPGHLRSTSSLRSRERSTCPSLP
jgi:hypothetical protein